MKELKLKKALKQIELAIRRSFIASLQLSSRFRNKKEIPHLPLQLSAQPIILFLRQDRLGDAIVSTPLFIELRKKYPNAHFIILLGENNRGISDLLPDDCEICIYQKKPLADIAMLLKLRRRKIDVLIDLMDNPSSTSSILTSMISACYSIGIDKANASSYNITVPLVNRAKFHIARRIIELVRPFGIDPESVSLSPRLKPVESQKVIGRVGIVLSAGAPNRYVSATTNAAIAERSLTQGLASEILYLFHPKDRDFADKVISKTHDSHIKLAPASNKFSEYAAQLCTCEFVISPDTSALHLCSAYGIPVLGLYAPFPPELHYWTPIGVPYEMIIQEPSLESLEVNNVICHLEKLMQKVRPEIHKEALTE